MMLCTPCPCSRSIRAASSPVEMSVPFPNWLMGKFWQNRQLRLQLERKMVPEPLLPEMGGSSPWWTFAEAMRGVRRRPADPGRTGQTVHPAVVGTEIAASQPRIGIPDPMEQFTGL